MNLLKQLGFVIGARAIVRMGIWLAIGLTLTSCAGAAGEPRGEMGRPAANQAPAASDPPSATEEQPAGYGQEVTAGHPTQAATLVPPSTRPGGAMVETALPAVPTPTATFDPAGWTSLPVLPELSPHARAVLAQGIARGNNPRAFSKIGDCESRTTWFLGDFDLDPQYYSLGFYEDELSPVIEHYRGSFNRLSQAARQGFTAASLLSPIWADRQTCEKGESPLACEYRLHRPVMAFILIGTNDAVNPKTFEGHMRKVIEISLEHGVLPVLGTKADNIEGDHAINSTLARLAYEYDVPLWNYWLAVQDLPGHGLQEDGAHLTFGTPHFDNPAALEKAWPVRNLNALQILRLIMDETEK